MIVYYQTQPSPHSACSSTACWSAGLDQNQATCSKLQQSQHAHAATIGPGSSPHPAQPVPGQISRHGTGSGKSLRHAAGTAMPIDGTVSEGHRAASSLTCRDFAAQAAKCPVDDSAPSISAAAAATAAVTATVTAADLRIELSYAAGLFVGGAPHHEDDRQLWGLGWHLSCTAHACLSVLCTNFGFGPQTLNLQRCLASQAGCGAGICPA